MLFIIFTPQPLRAGRVLFSFMVSGSTVEHLGGLSVSLSVGWQEIICLGCISETIRSRKLMLCRDIGYGCRCAMSWCDLDLTLYLTAVS